jgi:cytochrome o ubiquinol oxidase subunit I
MLVAEAGAVVILCGIAATVAQLIVSIRARDKHRDASGDPWNARTLEWSTASPPPSYNYAVMPQVEGLDAFWAAKQQGGMPAPAQYEAIRVPRNSPNGFVTALFAVITGFALIWHIWWMAILGLICAAGTLLAFGWLERGERKISAEKLAAVDRERAGAGRAA